MTPKEIISKVKMRMKMLRKHSEHDDAVKYIERRFREANKNMYSDAEEECIILVIARWILKVKGEKDSGVCAGCVGRDYNVGHYNYWFCDYHDHGMGNVGFCPAIKFCSPMLAYDAVENVLDDGKIPSKDFIYPLLLELCRDLLDENMKYEGVCLNHIYREIF